MLKVMHIRVSANAYMTLPGLPKSPKAICTKRSEVGNPLLTM